MPSAMDSELLIEESPSLVHVSLNRPAALNALSHAMITGLSGVLDRAAGRTILVNGMGGRAFCAGGDIKMQAMAIRSGDTTHARAYFRDEYALNAKIHAHPTPYVSFLNGITMGGGYGVSGHGSHLVATPLTQFAMPEVGIGFFPDIGAVWKLARVPNELGTYLAVTGSTVGPADMLYAGLVHAYMPVERFERLQDALAIGAPDEVLPSFSEDPGVGIFEKNESVIQKCFAGDTVEGIIDALKSDGSAFSLATAKVIEGRSPASLKVALGHIRRAKSESFSDVIARDLKLAMRFMDLPDFPEGVRAAVIDKDRRPRWNPPSLSQISDQMVALYLDSSGD